ncbi:MAG: sugar ABC transporter substrate-binding protein [Hyphomicrobiales bacterium]
MKKVLIGTLAAAMIASGAQAADKKVGASIASLEFTFLAVMAKGMTDHAAKLPGVKLQLEDAKNDVATQLSQVQNFIAAGVDAIVVNAVDTSATQAMTDAAAKAKIPLVYVNRQPINIDTLPDNQAFVASNEVDSGTLETKEICRILKEKGKGKGANIVVLVGELSNQAAVQRTKDVHDVIATPDCNFMKIVEEQTGGWKREAGQDIVTNWISKGVKFDAIVANNDDMALGALNALKKAGLSPKDIPVGGVDATQEALKSMQDGELAVTVFQDAAGQGKGSIDTALKLAAGEKVEKKVYIPFQLVTPANIKDYLSKN